MDRCFRFPRQATLRGIVCAAALAAVSGAPAAGEGIESPRLVMLAANPLEQARGRNNIGRDATHRELARQALLITAREEFGLATRDEALFEPIDRGSENTVDIVVNCSLGNRIVIQIRHRDSPVLEYAVKTMVGGPTVYNDLSGKLESLSRGLLLEAMKDMGFEPKPNAFVASAPLPERVESNLLKMNHLLQFQAVREIHRLIRESGESPERLAGLVRGYANLSQLLISVPDLRCQVFRARSLLYAKRLNNYRLAVETILGQAAEGYAFTMIGEPSVGLSHLKKAQTIAEKNGGELPAWHGLMVDYCYYRQNELRTRAHDRSPLSELAALLWFRSALQTTSTSLIIETGKQVQRLIPDCLWVTDQMVQSAGVIFNHKLTRLGPLLHGRQVGRLLREVDGLPAEVRQILDDPAREPDVFQRARIAKLLDAASEGEFDEPSLSVLGRDIEAWNALHILRRADFLKRYLGVSAEEYMEEVLPALDGYPMRPLLMSYFLSPGSTAEEYRERIGDYTFGGGSFFSVYAMLGAMPGDAKFTNMTAREAYDLVWYGHANCEQDDQLYLSRLLANGRYKDCAEHARSMKDYAANSPLRIAILIMYDWDASQPMLERWMQLVGDNPMISLAMARALAGRGDDEAAISYYESYLKAAPDAAVFRELADLHFQRYEDAEWLATMKRIFDSEDYNLDHSVAASSIAATLMHQGKFEEALPWAQLGAESGSSNGMTILGDCLTAMGRFAEAEQMAYYNTMRYGVIFGTNYWYDWCAETGHGRIEEAWRLKQEFLQRKFPPGDREHDFAHTVHLLATGRKEEARDMLVERLANEFSYWDTLTLALLHDELGESDQRDEALEKLATHNSGDGTRSAFVELAQLLQQTLPTGDVDQAAVDKILAEYMQPAVGEARGDWSLYLDYFIGVFLANRGKTEQAIERWKSPARWVYPNQWVRTLAWQRLREAGVDPAQIEGRYFVNQFWRPKRR